MTLGATRTGNALIAAATGCATTIVTSKQTHEIAQSLFSGFLGLFQSKGR